MLTVQTVTNLLSQFDYDVMPTEPAKIRDFRFLAGSNLDVGGLRELSYKRVLSERAEQCGVVLGALHEVDSLVFLLMKRGLEQDQPLD